MRRLCDEWLGRRRRKLCVGEEVGRKKSMVRVEGHCKDCREMKGRVGWERVFFPANIRSDNSD